MKIKMARKIVVIEIDRAACDLLKLSEVAEESKSREK